MFNSLGYNQIQPYRAELHRLHDFIKETVDTDNFKLGLDLFLNNYRVVSQLFLRLRGGPDCYGKRHKLTRSVPVNKQVEWSYPSTSFTIW